MNSDDAYMLTLFLVGVAILVGMFSLILRSPLRRRAGPDEPVPPPRAEPVDPTPQPSADVAPPTKAARKLGALGCIWHAVAPHLSYTIPGVLIVSLLHGWFLIDWAAGLAEAQASELRSRPFYWSHEATPLPSILINVAPTLFLLAGWLGHIEMWTKEHPEIHAQVEAAMDGENKILPTAVIAALSILGLLLVPAIPFAVFVLSQEFYRLFH